MQPTLTREELLAVGLDAAIIDDPHYVNIGTVRQRRLLRRHPVWLFATGSGVDGPAAAPVLQAVWHALEHAGYAPGAVPIRPAFSPLPG